MEVWVVVILYVCLAFLLWAGYAAFIDVLNYSEFHDRANLRRLVAHLLVFLITMYIMLFHSGV